MRGSEDVRHSLEKYAGTARSLPMRVASVSGHAAAGDTLGSFGREKAVPIEPERGSMVSIRHRFEAVAIAVTFGILAPACVPPRASTGAQHSTSIPTPAQALPSSDQTGLVADCALHQVRGALSAEACAQEVVVVPTRAPLPETFDGLDLSTGLHVTGRAPDVDLETYRLSVTGRVDRPLELSLADLRCMPKVSTTCPLVCPGTFVDVTTWAGVPMDHVLSEARVQAGANSLVFVSADGYSTLVYLEDVRASRGFLAYEWLDEPLPILHGFPLRVVLPGIDGNKWAKWLVRIEVH